MSFLPLTLSILFPLGEVSEQLHGAEFLAGVKRQLRVTERCHWCNTFLFLLEMQYNVISFQRMFLCLLLMLLFITDFKFSIFYSTFTLFLRYLSPSTSFVFFPVFSMGNWIPLDLREKCATAKKEIHLKVVPGFTLLVSLHSRVAVIYHWPNKAAIFCSSELSQLLCPRPFADYFFVWNEWTRIHIYAYLPVLSMWVRVE